MKASAYPVRRVAVLTLFTSPKNSMEALKTAPDIRRPSILILTALPLLPILVGLHLYTGLKHSLQSGLSMDVNPAVPFVISAIAGILFFLGQAFLLFIHYLMFMLLLKIFSSPVDGTTAKAVWWYALTPLMFRQIFYCIFLTIWGMPQLKNVSIIAYFDPFIVWTAVLIYYGCRKTLDLDRKTSSIITFLSSIVGLLGALGQAAGLG